LNTEKLKEMVNFKINEENKTITFNYEGGPKIVQFTVNEKGCFIPYPEVMGWDRFWLINGIKQHMPIKEVMGISKASCCLNPEHQQHECTAIEFGRRINKENHPLPIAPKAEIQKGNLPTKEKNDGVKSDGATDARRKLSDYDIALILESPKSDTEIAKIVGCSRDYANKVRKGKYRKS
jgi:hypothetical protein